MNEEVFRRYSAYYDLFYQDKDYEAEAEYVTRVLHDETGDVQKVLEFGSGTGRHGRLLARQGFDVFGVERSEAMVATANAVATRADDSQGGRFSCVQGDIRTVTLDTTFDAVLALFHVVSYQTRNGDVLQTFASASRHLRPGGIFFFDVWHGPAVLSERPSVRVKRVEDANTRLLRIAEPEMDFDASVVTVRYRMLAESKSSGQMETFQEEHRMRYFFPVEIDLLASLTGFEVERSEEFMTGNTPSTSTWGVAYLLRKTS